MEKRQGRKESRIIGKIQEDRRAGYEEDEAGIRKSGNKEEEGYLDWFFSLEISYASCAIVHVNIIPVIGKRSNKSARFLHAKGCNFF